MLFFEKCRHTLGLEIFRIITLNPYPVNSFTVVYPTDATISRKIFKVRSLVGQFRDIPDICLGRMKSKAKKLEYKDSE
jgi:hypothetical protein